jgi:hypothetical protein
LLGNAYLSAALFRLRANHAYALWPLLTFALWRSELQNLKLD